MPQRSYLMSMKQPRDVVSLMSPTKSILVWMGPVLRLTSQVFSSQASISSSAMLPEATRILTTSSNVGLSLHTRISFVSDIWYSFWATGLQIKAGPKLLSIDHAMSWILAISVCTSFWIFSSLTHISERSARVVRSSAMLSSTDLTDCSMGETTLCLT